MHFRYPLHIQISTLFVVLILLISGIVGVLGNQASRRILETTANQLNARISGELESEFNNLIQPASMATRLLAQTSLAQATTLAERMASFNFMRSALHDSPAITSIYIAYENGDFFFTRRFWNDADRKLFEAPAEAAYLIQSIEHLDGQAKGQFIYLDLNGQMVRQDDLPDYAKSYDPRTRDWYKSATGPDQINYTSPYLFFASQMVGSTISMRAPVGNAVAGADIRLATLAHTLAHQKVTPGNQIVLANTQGRVIAYEDIAKVTQFPDGKTGKPTLAHIGELDVPVFSELATKLDGLDFSKSSSFEIKVSNDDWRISITPVLQDGTRQLVLISAIPDQELMAEANHLLQRLLIAVIAIILLAIPITWLVARSVAKPLRQLAKDAEAIRRFEFETPINVRSPVLEVNELARTMGEMKRTIRRFLDISMVVAAEKDFDRLLPRLLSETLTAAGAESGILYLDEDNILICATALRQDGSSFTPEITQIPTEAAGPLLAKALETGKPQAASLNPAAFQALGIGELLANGTPHAIAVPLLNRQKQRIGAMLLLCPEASDQARLSFVEALSGSVAVSLESKELIKAQKMLFEAFIQLIAGAIDAKSAYTGGHCSRVPELTKMLARAACAETSGPYADFQLSDEDWEAVHVAAWLHDCGKVTTPEYVVDKATKLETLYDRIHEIRMRFEVLKRDAEIDCLKEISTGTEASAARQQLSEVLAQLDSDFAFIASCNEGGEFMAPEKIVRLNEIARRTWTRTLNDRIGISHEELERKSHTPPPTLPVTETLLADKPEHIFDRPAREKMPADNKWGFRMPVPELLYNKGELYNLGVARGTLSEEERYKINEHIVQTLIMLTQLPFPKHLRGVPEIAAGHHEKMDGTGYPRRLSRDEMSPVARMMAIADIFEALTAVDRPYKKGKTLSEAIKIMSFMKKDQHIDPELFDLFLRSGAYLEYAERFMKPEQIDQVDLAAYVDKPAS
jgi:HD-GYP domain-containing protein (c-di-GMP phosphodiesterase class II)/HAMP domain-containing protein